MEARIKFSLICALSTFTLTSNSFADYEDQLIIRPDSHAPIGVMGDHLHAKGEWMLSFRSMSMNMEGHRAGENELSTEEVLERGYTSAATEMSMDMQMFGVMYAPSNRITLMAMANYISKEMTMVSQGETSHDMSHGTSMDESMDMSTDMDSDMDMSMTTMNHSTEGWGDVKLMALVSMFEKESGRLHLNLGFSAPTGAVDEMMHGVFQPYGMQLGSGTWDSILGATFVSKYYDSFSWGAQALATIRLEDENDSGYSRSDALDATIWGAWMLSNNLSIGTRLIYSAEGSLDGHYNDTHNHSAPPHFQENYGGDILQAALSLNFVFQEGALKGSRIALEMSAPIYQQLNGVGMNREETITLGWQLAW